MKKVLLLIPVLLFIVGVAFTPDDVDGNLVIKAYETADGGSVDLILPSELHDYEAQEVPEHYVNTAQVFGNSIAATSTNPNWETNGHFSNEGATLGRVLFYDRNLSINRQVSCGSCHNQSQGFAEEKEVSEGFNGMLGTRNALNIAEIDFSPYENLLWDDRESELNHMAILPLLDGNEMGISMEQLVTRLNTLDYYPPLFQMAFGSTDINQDRIGDALAQFMRTFLPLNSKLDQGIQNDFAEWTDEEVLGKTLFQQDCQSCHSSVVSTATFEEFENLLFENGSIFGAELMFMFQGPHNTGLDMEYEDQGMGALENMTQLNGVFKTPNIKNIALTGPYMHDGRFATLEEVVDFYSDDILPHENSHFEMNEFIYDDFEDPDSGPDSFVGFEYTPEEKAAMVAFLETLTDQSFVTDEKYSDPFVYGTVGINDLDLVEMGISPNPVVDVATVVLNDSFEGQSTRIRLMDIAGKTIWTDQTNTAVYNFQRGQVPSGTYILEAVSSTHRSSDKVVLK